MESTGTVHVWQQVLEELKVPFAVKDDHGYAVRSDPEDRQPAQDPAR